MVMNELEQKSKKIEAEMSEKLDETSVKQQVWLLRKELKHHWFMGKIWNVLILIKDMIKDAVIIYLMFIGLLYMPNETQALFDTAFNVLKDFMGVGNE